MRHRQLLFLDGELPLQHGNAFPVFPGKLLGDTDGFLVGHVGGETATAFDVASEPEKVRERYGENVNGMSLLLARRLVEANVPFITVFWKEYETTLAKKCKSAGGWDTHGNNLAA